MPARMNPGLLFCVLAFSIWGMFPLYFRMVAQVSPVEVVLHRYVWGLVFVLGVLTLMRRRGWLREALASRRTLATFAVSAALLIVNWFFYVYAVQSGHVIEASLGYFINPLLNVMLGVLVLHERLRRVQWVAVAMAALGVAWLTWQTGRLPWIALVLAGTFGLYGLLRKQASLGALEGLALETMMVALVAVPALVWWTAAGTSALAQADPALTFWLLLAGPLTALPLMFFAAGARRLPLATVGLVQYLSPTLQLLLGIWVFHEPFDADRLVGFACIWAGLALYSADALGLARARARA